MRLYSLFLILAATLWIPPHARAADRHFDHDAIRDPATLDVRILQDWHEVEGPVPTRQKVINILVHEVIPGKPYRIPVRFIVPQDRKAKGFHLTGGHRLRDFEGKGKVFKLDEALLERNVGRVQTMIQTLNHSGQAELGDALFEKFIETLDPKYSIQYYGWPLTLMKAITAAHAETDHFEPGKIAMSGGSKNGATPSTVLNVDDRTTAVHASVSPIWDSPLRLCDAAAWKELRAFNEVYAASAEPGNPQARARLRTHPFLGGAYGPIYNDRALAAGHSWEDLQSLAESMADNVFISRNADRLNARGAEFLFQPGTHDFVCFDLAWGGRHHPRIPLYLRANSGHGINPLHPKAARGNDNLAAFLYQHFFEEFDGMLEPPTVSSEMAGNALKITVRFEEGAEAEDGRVWWMFDRGPDGSAAYIRDRIPDDQWADMAWDEDKGAWTVEIPVQADAKLVDFFSSHRKTLRYRGADLGTYVSSPYTRVLLE